LIAPRVQLSKNAGSLMGLSPGSRRGCSCPRDATSSRPNTHRLGDARGDLAHRATRPRSSGQPAAGRAGRGDGRRRLPACSSSQPPPSSPEISHPAPGSALRFIQYYIVVSRRVTLRIAPRWSDAAAQRGGLLNCRRSPTCRRGNLCIGGTSWSDRRCGSLSISDIGLPRSRVMGFGYGFSSRRRYGNAPVVGVPREFSSGSNLQRFRLGFDTNLY
jgi:hypothetical protein